MRVAAVDGHGFSVTPFAAECRAQRRTRALGGRRRLDEGRDGQRLRLAQGPASLRTAAVSRGGGADRAHPERRGGPSSRSRAAGTRRSPRRSSPQPAGEHCASSSRWTPTRSSSPVSRSSELTSTVCPRDGRPGDPAYRRLLRALEEGAVPFTCQGNLNGLAVEGGETLGWEIVSTGTVVDRLVVQVGGGALASACVQALTRGASRSEPSTAIPRLDTVQTEAAWPLKRAFDAIEARGNATRALRLPRRTAPRSCGRGSRRRRASRTGSSTTRRTTGSPSSRRCSRRAAGRRSCRRGDGSRARTHSRSETTGIDVDPTGSAGLAGLLALREAAEITDDERIAVLFTGVVRAAPTERRRRDEELSRTRHPVAQGLRAG